MEMNEFSFDSIDVFEICINFKKNDLLNLT